MTSSAKDFFYLMVQPTVHEFISEPCSLRRGLLAALVLNHMADHVAQEGQPIADRSTMNNRVKAVNDKIRGACPEAEIIKDIADVAKHAKLSFSKNQRSVSELNNISGTPGLFNAPFGEGGFLEAVEIYVTLSTGSSKPLLPLVNAAYEAWNSYVEHNP